MHSFFKKNLSLGGKLVLKLGCVLYPSIFMTQNLKITLFEKNLQLNNTRKGHQLSVIDFYRFCSSEKNWGSSFIPIEKEECF